MFGFVRKHLIIALPLTTNKDAVKEGHLKGKINRFPVAPLEKFTIKFTANVNSKVTVVQNRK